MSADTTKVTIVIATYHRPDALAATIGSVLLQTEKDWQLFVIGDYCTDNTEAVVASFNDPRIRFINLPARCMEQAIPNSIGMMLADTDYIALLNHDDMWLPDHLETALKTLAATRAELFIGYAAFARLSYPAPHGKCRPFFTEGNVPNRKLAMAFTTLHVLFEPCSAWVFHKSLVQKVGLWKPTLTMFRTPIQDWILRCWRKGVRVTFGMDITVFKFGTHYKGGSEIHAYTDKAYEQHYTLRLITRFGGETARAVASGHMRSNARKVRMQAQSPWHLVTTKTPKERLVAGLLLNRFFARIYWLSGFDSYGLCCKILRISKSSHMLRVTKRRTGETLQPAPQMDILLRYAQAQLA